MSFSSRAIVYTAHMLVAACLFLSCSSDPQEESPDVEITYTGEFETYRISLGQQRIDTVQFVVLGQTYHLYHDTRQTRICDSYGDLFAFGRPGPGVNFASADYVGSNCDTVRLPSGFFTAIYRNDSVYMSRDADTSALDITYQFRLAKR